MNADNPKSFYAFGNRAIFKLEPTVHSKTKMPSLNLEIYHGEKSNLGKGTSIDMNRETVNLQLSDFEMAELACLFLAHRREVCFIRDDGRYIKLTRQAYLGAIQIYVQASNNATLPIKGGHVYFASMLCLGQLTKLTPGVPIGAVMGALGGMDSTLFTNPNI